MGFGTFRREELPAQMSRTIRWRWPGERLLALVPCEAEYEISRPRWSRSPDEIAPANEHGHEPGLLGVTERRIVFRSLERSGLAFRVSAWTFAALAVIGFLSAEPTMTPIASILALITWAVGRVIETLGLGSAAIELERIVEVDPAARRIHGVDPWGVDYRLRLTESDLAIIAPLLGR